jgi:hypothetical protein
MQPSDFLKEGERCEVSYYDEFHKLIYIIITKDKFRDKFYLLDVDKGKRKEIASADTPLRLEKKMKKFNN